LVALLMRREEAMRRLRERRVELQQQLGVERLYMCGSTARDEAREDSDVDPFFYYPRGKFGLFELMDMKERMAKVPGRKTDVMTKDSLYEALRASVEAPAVRVFQTCR
jgi:uncharacterized protein